MVDTASDFHFTFREGKTPALIRDTNAKLRAEETAIIVIDLVNWQAAPEGAVIQNMRQAQVDTSYFLDRIDSLVCPNLQRLTDTFRAGGARVIFARCCSLQDDYADVLPNIQSTFRAGGARDGRWECRVIDALKPAPNDLDVVKTGSSCFAGTGLDTFLRNAGIRNVVYTGIVANGCVLLTASSGYDLGYNGFVVADAMATHSDRLQAATEEIIDTFIAEVVTTDALLARLVPAKTA
jgi:nicotinamidase-related amidase